MKSQPLLLLAGLGLPLFLAGCEDDKTVFFPPKSIPEQLDALGLTTLRAAVEAAGLVDDLEAAGPFTLFAPSNAAFAALPAGTLDSLLEPANQAQLIDLLQYHLLTEASPSLVLIGEDTETAANGDPLLLNVIDGALFVNDGQVTQNDVPATNGFIHVIDTVLRPPQTLAATLTTRGFTTLVAAATAADLDDELAAPGSLTVFAPTQAAFAALPAGALNALLLPQNQQQLIDLLSFHISPSTFTTTDGLQDEELLTLLGPDNILTNDAQGNLRIDGVRLVATNIPCTNGILHSIEAVLDTPVNIPATATAGGFSTLVTALTAAGLVDDLQAAGPFTVFAPTNAAFAALPAGVLDSLLEPGNQATLIDVLTYHVLASQKLTASELAGLATVTTLEGSTIAITNPSAGLTLNGNTRVTAANVIALNGLVHAIDRVLLPPGFVPPPSSVALSTEAPSNFEGIASQNLQAEGLSAALADLPVAQIEEQAAFSRSAGFTVRGLAPKSGGFSGPLAGSVGRRITLIGGLAVAEIDLLVPVENSAELMAAELGLDPALFLGLGGALALDDTGTMRELALLGQEASGQGLRLWLGDGQSGPGTVALWLRLRLPPAQVSLPIEAKLLDL
jgi:uncharacterized surface protein with fasciclin (FAS1) repeats